MLAFIWILSCTKARTHNAWFTLKSPDFWKPASESWHLRSEASVLQGKVPADFPVGSVEMVKLFTGNLPREATEPETTRSLSSTGSCWNVTSLRTMAFCTQRTRKQQRMPYATCTTTSYTSWISIWKPATIRAKSPQSCMWATSVPRVPAKSFRPSLRSTVQSWIRHLKDYAFTPMEWAEDAVEALKGLDSTEFHAKQMHMQLSTSWLRTVPGIGDHSAATSAGKRGTGPKSVW